MVAELRAQGLLDAARRSSSRPSTASRRRTPAALTRIDDGPIIDGLNAAWKAAHPGAGDRSWPSGTDDDAMLMWLNDRKRRRRPTSPSNYLLRHAAPATTSTAAPKASRQSGLRKVYAGAAAGALLRRAGWRPARPGHLSASRSTASSTPAARARSPSTAAPTPRTATSRSSSTRRGSWSRACSTQRLETTQIAPTILRLLGLDPDALQAVRIQGTPVLPGVR